MDIAIGTEVRDEYLSWEVEAGARKLVENIMLTEEGETVVISADTSSDMRVVQATARAVYAAGAMPIVVLHPTLKEAFTEAPAPLAGAVERTDVWIEFAVNMVFLSSAWRAALDQGARYICLTGMDVTMLVNTIQRVRYDKVEVYSPGGTELTAFNQGRRARQSGKLADTKGEAIMLGGQVSWCPMEETINGKLVFDAALFPPAQLGKLTEKVELILKEGVVKEVAGGGEAKIFERWLASFNDPNMYRLAHYSLGFNPGVTKASGRIVEDERIFGIVEMGIGSQGPQIRGKTWTAAAHTDGVVMNPTIVLDGVDLEKDGVYQIESVREACRELGVPGY
jgi:leucyl aminopeptidase (aminopeptidase T)